MTATINIFSMPQTVSLTMGGNTGATLMNYPVNRTDFKLAKGVTTEVIFFIKNVDRHPVAAPGTPKMVITDPDTRKVLIERELTQYTSNSNQIMWYFTATATDIQDWPVGLLQYCVVVERQGGDQVMLYTDRSYGPYSGCEVIQGPYPDPPEAITSDATEWLHDGLYVVSSAYPGAASVGNISGVHGIQVNFANSFVGTIKVQASLEQQPSTEDTDWFDADSMQYTEPQSDPVYLQVVGQYLWVRLMANSTAGNISNAIIRST